MFIKSRNKVSKLFRQQSLRSQKVLRNIFSSFGVKGATIIVSMLLVSVNVNYITPTEYGVWVTITSIVSWMSFLDVGLCNGLRNQLTVALANNEKEKARTLISTTYISLAIISCLLFAGVASFVPYINWNSLFNIPPRQAELSSIITITLGSFCLLFTLQTVNTILMARQYFAKASLNIFLGQLLSLIVILFLKTSFSANLFNFVVVMSVCPLIIMAFVSVYYFTTSLSDIAPSYKKIDFKSLKGLSKLGVSFFIIQIGALVLFQTDNIIITEIAGPSSVAEFNVSYKFFSVVTLAFSIIMGPYWSAFTDAHSNGDFRWIKKSIVNLRLIWMLASILVIPTLVILSQWAYSLWIGNTIHIPFILSVVMGIYSIGYMCLSLNSFVLNGIGTLKIQVILYVVSSVVNVPLGLYLGKLFGVEGVVLSNIVVFLVMNVCLWVQINRIFKLEQVRLGAKINLR